MNRIPYWTEHWNDIIARVIARPRLLVASDFDGSLTPIVSHPNDAWLPDEVRSLLRRISQCKGTTLAIVSGRSLADLKSRVGIDGSYYAGNHGLELEGPGCSWTSPDAIEHCRELRSAVVQLRGDTARFTGAIVEDKHLTATVHWRLVDPKELTELREVVTSIVRSHANLRLFTGNGVWEIRPRVRWNTGSAVLHLLARLKLTTTDAIYIGDDNTDEGVFAIIPEALTLRIGGDTTATSARLRLNDPGDTAAFLFCLFSARLSGSGWSGGNIHPLEFQVPRPVAGFSPH